MVRSQLRTLRITYRECNVSEETEAETGHPDFFIA